MLLSILIKKHAIEIRGIVKEDKRSEFGYRVGCDWSLKVIGISDNYPIT